MKLKVPVWVSWNKINYHYFSFNMLGTSVVDQKFLFSDLEPTFQVPGNFGSGSDSRSGSDSGSDLISQKGGQSKIFKNCSTIFIFKKRFLSLPVNFLALKIKSKIDSNQWVLTRFHSTLVNKIGACRNRIRNWSFRILKKIWNPTGSGSTKLVGTLKGRRQRSKYFLINVAIYLHR